MSNTRKPSLAAVVRRALDARLADVRVCLPAKVTRYDATKQQIDAQPLLDASVEGEDGTSTALALPVITNIPVVFPGGGGFTLTFPIAVDDTVVLLFSDRSLDEWLAKGGEVAPADPRLHHVSDAIAVPGLRPFSNPLAGASASKAFLGKDGGPGIFIDAAHVNVGGDSGLEPATLANTLANHLAAVKTWLDTLTLVTACGAGAGSAGPPAVPSPTPPNVASAVVQIKT